MGKRFSDRFEIGMMELPKGTISVRILAYLALSENDQIFNESRICGMRCVVLTWRVFYSVFSLRRLVVPHSEHRCEGTPLLFLRPVVVDL